LLNIYDLVDFTGGNKFTGLHSLYFRTIITMMVDGRPRGPSLRSGGDEVCLVRSELSLL
jgi:hypothetical protein